MTANLVSKKHVIPWVERECSHPYNIEHAGSKSRWDLAPSCRKEEGSNRTGNCLTIKVIVLKPGIKYIAFRFRIKRHNNLLDDTAIQKNFKRNLICINLHTLSKCILKL